MTMKKASYFVPAFLYYVLIFILSSQAFGDIHFPGHGLDKVAHFIEFSLLGFFLSIGYFNAFSLTCAVKSVLVFLTGLPLGILDEVHQRFVPGRTSALTDVMADGAGIIAGILVYLCLAKRKKRSPENGAT
jgi:VanZ family protein